MLLPISTIERVVDELEDFPHVRKTYLNGYDEPTLNPRLATIVKMMAHLPASITLFTNGTNLTPDLADWLADTGANIDFDVHLSAVNPNDFIQVHQSRLYNRVISNLRYLAENFTERRHINVCVSMQALNTPEDDRRWQELREYFCDTSILTFRWKPNDRAGLLSHTRYAMHCNHGKLRGCMLDNRTEEWIHINASRNVVVCCQDYNEDHVLGRVGDARIIEILMSPIRQQYRKWTLGEIEAPAEYICRRCSFAATSDPTM
jgi:MoaA/NifB/PqqE/SkfB family radical SAM enzyme